MTGLFSPNHGMNKPDYERLRQEAGFSWRVAGSQDAILKLSGFPQHAIALDPALCIEAYRKGRPLFREMWGDGVQMLAVATPHISYGHINGLGAKLTFPAGGEVGHTRSMAPSKRALRR